MTALYDAEQAAVDGLGLTDIEMDLIVSLLDDYVRGAARGDLDPDVVGIAALEG